MTTPPAPLSQRFTLELEFVLCLSNPHYLQHLAMNFPNLLNNPTSARKSDGDDESDAAKFARYLKYLYDYWRTPQYAQYLTHPAATLRNLELLQQEQFRKDIIRPDVIAKLLETDASHQAVQDLTLGHAPEEEQGQTAEGEAMVG